MKLAQYHQKRKLFSLVRKEAKNLKKHATKQELGKLDLHNLCSLSPSRCIYGQMTGDCYGGRAGELIIKCAERVYNSPNGSLVTAYNQLNGKPELVNDNDRQTKYHSPIEVLIYYSQYRDGFSPRNNSVLIDYLQGKTEKLILE